jgi:hypothetical protein
METYRLTLSQEEYFLIKKLVGKYDADDLVDMFIDKGDYNLAWQALLDVEVTKE